MVVFTCNNCGDSLKKNKVDQHSWQCKTNSFTCVDCQRDFNLDTYSSHNECITENQKYCGPNYKAPELKGKNKQNDWIKKIKQLIEENQYPKDIQFILNSLLNYDNIPRKKAKFGNFVKNSFRIRDESKIEKVWAIFEASLKNGNTNGQIDKPNSTPDDLKRKTEHSSTNGNDESCPKKVKVDQPKSDELNETEQVKMKQVMTDIVAKYSELSVRKLQRKVIKFYHKIGCTDDEAILAKFEKTLKRKKFIINNDIITLNQ